MNYQQVKLLIPYPLYDNLRKRANNLGILATLETRIERVILNDLVEIQKNYQNNKNKELSHGGQSNGPKKS